MSGRFDASPLPTRAYRRRCANCRWQVASFLSRPPLALMAFALALDIIAPNSTSRPMRHSPTATVLRSVLSCPWAHPTVPLIEDTDLTPGSHRNQLEQSRSVTIVGSGPFEDHLPTLQH